MNSPASMACSGAVPVPAGLQLTGRRRASMPASRKCCETATLWGQEPLSRRDALGVAASPLPIRPPLTHDDDVGRERIVPDRTN